MTLAGTPLLFLASVLFTFTLKLHKQDTIQCTIIPIQSVVSWTCLYFSYSIFNAFKIFFASYINNDNSLLRGNISPSNHNNYGKHLLGHPYYAFKLYNLTNADCLVNFLQLGYKIFSTSSSKKNSSVHPPFCPPNTCPIMYLFRTLQQFPGDPLLLVQPIFSKPPWRLWLRDLFYPIVTLGSPNLDLGSLRHPTFLQIHLTHQAPPQAHLGTPQAHQAPL